MEEQKKQQAVKRVSSYDLEPVRYCSKCYSLRVGYIEGVSNSDYCLDCGCTDIADAPIGEWERAYKDRYGRKFVERRIDPLKLKIYKMSWDELKQKFYSSSYYQEVIRAIYPRFPKYKSKEDAMLSFIGRIGEEHRVEEFKEQMYINSKRYND